jgi:hypothetical protein
MSFVLNGFETVEIDTSSVSNLSLRSTRFSLMQCMRRSHEGARGVCPLPQFSAKLFSEKMKPEQKSGAKVQYL